MKNLFLLILVFSCFVSPCQPPCNDNSGSWHIEKGNTYLQLIYNDTLSDSISLFNNLLNKSRTMGGDNLHILGDAIEFQINNHNIDFDKIGKKRMKAAICVIWPIDFNVTIEVKNKKYRVTITNVITKTGYGTQYYSPYIWNKDPYNKDGCLRNFGINNILESFDTMEKDFRNLFVFEQNIKKSDW